ncbi:hypothetical protein SS50377_20662 [Spironucleus salmonicida]|uniref:Uncharacterized protein n=1 Tax=Spironucleus salmonicida TaxID=348837 RepID=V6M0E2_9EUKA|nr:hypothetical protein SS50377_20662 [Spironucleus salmonicida]|eukprot:EST49511.1 Hypothetical protein SS50377_10113 [Spironucleus salmonicida]
MNLSYATMSLISKSKLKQSACSTLSLQSSSYQQNMTKSHNLENSQRGVKENFKKPKKRPLSQVYFPVNNDNFQLPINTAFQPLNMTTNFKIPNYLEYLSLMHKRADQVQPNQINMYFFSQQQRTEYPEVFVADLDINQQDLLYDPKIDNPSKLLIQSTIQNDSDENINYIIQTNDFRLLNKCPTTIQQKSFIDAQTTLIFEDLKNIQQKDDLSVIYEKEFNNNYKVFHQFSDTYSQFQIYLSAIKSQVFITEHDEFFDSVNIISSINLSRNSSLANLSFSRNGSYMKLERHIEQIENEAVKQNSNKTGIMKFILREDDEDWRSFVGCEVEKKQ